VTWLEPARRWDIMGWEINACRARPLRWLPRLTRVSTGWKRGWGEQNILWRGGDLRWLSVYLTWRRLR
jgi:hypothetical protein